MFDGKAIFFCFVFSDDPCYDFARTIDASYIGEDEIDVIRENISALGLFIFLLLLLFQNRAYIRRVETLVIFL